MLYSLWAEHARRISACVAHVHVWGRYDFHLRSERMCSVWGIPDNTWRGRVRAWTRDADNTVALWLEESPDHNPKASRINEEAYFHGKSQQIVQLRVWAGNGDDFERVVAEQKL